MGPGYGCDSLVELEEEHVDSEDEMASLSPVVRRPLGVCSYLAPMLACLTVMLVMTYISALTERVIKMGKESVQQKLTKVRAPRVKITYDVQVGDAQEVKELPFVMGVLGDLTGQPENPMAPLKERPFVEIGPDNFDDVLKGMAPHLRFSVTNKLSSEPDARQVGVDLKFEKVDDFSPAAVARQVEPLKQLLDLRTRLSDLRGSLQGNDQLDQALFDAVSKTEELAKLRSEFESRKPEESK